MEPEIVAASDQVQPPAQRGAVLPSQAFNRFDPPEGFAPVALGGGAKRVRYGFRAAGHSFLVPERMPSEVVPPMSFAEIPNGPVWLRGMINLHGNLVPVCELNRILDSATRSGADKPMILVLGKSENAVGFVIDGYPVAVSGLKQTNRIPELNRHLERYVTDMLVTEDEVWLEFDHEGFLHDANQQ